MPGPCFCCIPEGSDGSWLRETCVQRLQEKQSWGCPCKGQCLHMCPGLALSFPSLEGRSKLSTFHLDSFNLVSFLPSWGWTLGQR